MAFSSSRTISTLCTLRLVHHAKQMKNTMFAATKQITKRASASTFKPRILTLVLFFALPVF